MSSHPVLLHIEIVDHLDHDTCQTTKLLAQQDLQPHSLRYIEKDGSTKVELLILEKNLILKRSAEWNTQIDFNLNGLGSFTVVSDQGTMEGVVKLLKHRIESNTIELTYQLIIDGSIVTHQTIRYNIKGAQA